jgi:hypothetical protein
MRRFFLQLLLRQSQNGKLKKKLACWNRIKITQKKTFIQLVNLKYVIATFSFKINEKKNNIPFKTVKDDSVLADSDEEMETEAPRFVAHVAVPSQKEVEEAILRRKKQELLEKYVSSELLKETEETSKTVNEMNS